MAVSNTTVAQLYNGNDSLVDFAIPFAFISGELGDIDVYLVDEATGEKTLKTISTHYTLTPSGDDPTLVTFNTAPTSDEKVLIERTLAYTQVVDYINSARVSPEQVELGMDRLVLMAQQLYYLISKAPLFNILDSSFSRDLPLIEADGVLAVNSAGDAFEFVALDDLEGAVGPQGETGPQGPAGSGILSGTTAPADSLGSEGDLYLRTTTGVLYGPKTTGASPWATTLSLVGPTGPTGPNYGVTLKGTRASPRVITLANGITSTDSHMDATVIDQVIFAEGPAPGENAITADPQIQDGQTVGQRMRICCPNGSTNWLRMEHGRGIRSNGPMIFDEDGKSFEFFWDGVDWVRPHGW